MDIIIDTHTHLGDILYPGGGKLIEKKGIKKKPIPPHVTFEDIKMASQKDQGIIPFTGIDYTKDYDLEVKLAADIAAGAKGLKLHPIIQRVPLTSTKTFEAVEAFDPYRLPVLFHCGVSSYYLGSEKTKENPTYGEIHYVMELVKAFPKVNFIAGHAGLSEVKDVIRMLGKYKNV